MSRNKPVVAIDGPAGAGKTTVTRRVADALGYTLVDTGALYRGVALAARRRAVSWDDEAAVADVARDLAAQGALRFEAGGARLCLGAEDVSTAIRSQEIAEGASKVSAWPGVRAALLGMQRALGEAGGVVLEGRDIGTVVFPDAEAKFFLTASVAVRAERRFAELRARGVETTLDAVKAEVEARDVRDSTRSAAPLKQARDAVLVDSSERSIDQVVDFISARVRDVETRLTVADSG
ncbi:MAG: (d)CMP kinase [Polyangiaceae bacterium]